MQKKWGEKMLKIYKTDIETNKFAEIKEFEKEVG